MPTDLRELFAWTVREGVTNVIRHSGAPAAPCGSGTRGRGPRRRHRARRTGRPRHGLDGLRERATAAGAVLVTRTLDPRGFALSVSAR